MDLWYSRGTPCTLSQSSMHVTCSVTLSTADTMPSHGNLVFYPSRLPYLLISNLIYRAGLDVRAVLVFYWAYRLSISYALFSI